MPFQKRAYLLIHLSAAFGLGEICAELIELVNMPVFEKAWLQYCTLYNAPAAEQIAVFGKKLDGINLQQGHSKLTAFAAKRTNNAALAARAWVEFYGGAGGIRQTSSAIKGVFLPFDLSMYRYIFFMVSLKDFKVFLCKLLTAILDAKIA